MPRGRQNFASLMVAVGVVDTQVDVRRLHVESQAFVLDMVVENDVRWMAALVVLKDTLVYAFLMVVDAVASMNAAQKVHKEVPCIVRPMGEGNDVYLPDAQKVLKEVLLFARDMVGESVASLMGVGFAQKVYMGAQTFVLLMVVERGVLCQDAQKVLVGALIAVSDMVEASDANSRTVERVPKGAQTSAKPMEVENDAHGEKASAKNLQGVKVVYVLLIVA